MLKYEILIKFFVLNCLSEVCSRAVYIVSPPVTLIFCICKLFLMFFVIYPSKNSSLKMATIGGRNM